VADPALHLAWQKWCSFADGLDLRDGSADCAALHVRLFRLSGNHPPRSKHLDDTRVRLCAALDPWLGRPAGEPVAELEALRQAMSACEPAWRAILGTGGARSTNHVEVERAALAAALAWPSAPFWTSGLFGAGNRFDPLGVQRGRETTESLAALATLLGILNHPRGEPLWQWLSTTPALTTPAQALHAAALFRDAAEAGVIAQRGLLLLGWGPLATTLDRLCQEVCLCLLNRLNEPLPATDSFQPARSARQKARAAGANYRRPVPDPLPIDPFFQNLPGSEPFLRSIAAEPLEDAHRLVFADWLEEAGQEPRAAFIRLQCRHDQLPPFHVARTFLQVEFTSLFYSHYESWRAGLSRLDGAVSWGELSNFCRGMIETVSTVSLPGPAGCDEIFRIIDARHLRLRIDGPEQLRTLLERPWLPQLISLDLSCEREYEAEQLRAVGQSEALAGLVDLQWHDCWNVRPAAALVDALDLPNLTRLSVNSINTAPAERRSLLRALADSPALRRIRTLNLGISGIDLTSFQSVVAAPALSGLEQLDLAWNRFSGRFIEPVASSPFLANLRMLDVSHNNLGNKGAQALADSPFLKGLVHLNLRDTDLRRAGARALAGSSNLAKLTVLDLGENKEIGSGLRALIESPNLDRLRSLNLSQTAATVQDVRALANGSHLANLEALSLSKSGIADEGARLLADSPWLQKLVFLDLSENELSPEGKAAIAQRWPRAWV
jgi:uncharacterized protein (TIGR02996 family)